MQYPAKLFCVHNTFLSTQVERYKVRLGVSRNRTNVIEISQKHSYGYAVANRIYEAAKF